MVTNVEAGPGYLANDDALPGTRRGELVVHEWPGLRDNERMMADKLAELGYVAFAVDVYGKGTGPAGGAMTDVYSWQHMQDFFTEAFRG